MTSTWKFYSHNFAWKLGLNMHKHVKSRPKILKLDSLNISLSSWFWIFLKWSYMWMNNWFKILAFFLKHYVCYGLAWNGAVWFSCVWIGLVRYFMVWFGMVLFCFLFGFVLFGMVWFGMVWFVLFWDNIHLKLLWKFWLF